MKQQPDEQRMRELFQAMKRQDAARAPGFDTTVRTASERKPWWKTPIVPVGLGLALSGATAAVAVVFVVNQGSGSAPMSTAVHPATPRQTEPLAALLQRPGEPLGDAMESSPIPKRRLLGGWE